MFVLLIVVELFTLSFDKLTSTNHEIQGGTRMIVLVDVLIATWKRPDDEEVRESTLQRTTNVHF